MQEELLHFVWKHKLFSMNELQTVGGEPVSILQSGQHNTNAGPDFLNAQVIIGDTHWAGHVEMHVKTSDWDAHGHSGDKAYDNVILHVVFQHDKPRQDEKRLPVLNLSPYISTETIRSYEKLKSSQDWIPCQFYLPKVNPLSFAMWMERMLVERLEAKAELIQFVLQKNANDWAETAYQLIARCFGFHVNSMPMEMLSQRLPLKVLIRHAGNIQQLEALIFGQAGMLEEEFKEEYAIKLKKEYGFLASKYSLKAMRKADWRFLRLRPDNFPSIRLAEFAGLMRKSDRFFSILLEIKSEKDAFDFLDAKASGYWNDHYRLEVASKENYEKHLGKESRKLLIINGVVPLLFAYGHLKGIEKYKEKALEILEKLQSEKNHITKGWEKLGVENKDARQSQALLHLKNEYCDKRLCLKCTVGSKILLPKISVSD